MRKTKALRSVVIGLTALLMALTSATDGGWFSVEVKKEKEAARRFVVSFEPNMGPTSRSVELHVDAMRFGHYTSGYYHIILSQAPFDGN
jgi:hypothetical protein